MQVIHWGKARKFYQAHPRAKEPLRRWKVTVQAADWKSFADIRSTFSTADWVDGNIVFDIKGNDYRLIAIAHFERDRLYIWQVLTHEEYDKEKWKR